MSNPAMNIASTLQSASLNRAPSPTHDINPSTAASAKEPITISSPPPSPSPSPSARSSSQSSESTIPLPQLRPTPRRTNLPPLPDLRFEQSYLASIKHARSGSDVALITIKDQVLMPLVQGLLWALVLQGWRHWNSGVELQGEGIGARVRRWWWDVNGWKEDGATAGAGAADSRT